MGKAISYDKRVKIVSRLKTGESIKELSDEMGLSESGIKKIWYKYQKEGDKAYVNSYGNCGQKSLYSAEIKAAIREIRDNGQGGAYVRSKLLEKFPGMRIPSERTIQRWWVSEGTNREKGRPGEREKKVESNPS